MRLCKGHTATAQGTITKAQRTSEKAQGTMPIDVGSFGYLMSAWLFFPFSCRVFRVGSVAAMDTVSQWDILNSCSHNIGLLWDWLCANVCHIQIIRPDLLHVALMRCSGQWWARVSQNNLSPSIMAGSIWRKKVCPRIRTNLSWRLRLRLDFHIIIYWSVIRPEQNHSNSRSCSHQFRYVRHVYVDSTTLHYKPRNNHGAKAPWKNNPQQLP